MSRVVGTTGQGLDGEAAQGVGGKRAVAGEQEAIPVLAQFAPIITFVLAGGGFWITSTVWPPRVLSVTEDVHVDEQAMA